MGKVRRPKQFLLKFEDPEMEGFEIRAQSTSLGNLLDFLDLAEGDRRDFSKEDKERLVQLFEIFMENVREWNVMHEVKEKNDEGEVISVREVDTPRTVDGLLLHDPDFALDVVFAWMDGVVGMGGPLARKSSDGNPSVEQSIPMEVL